MRRFRVVGECAGRGVVRVWTVQAESADDAVQAAAQEHAEHADSGDVLLAVTVYPVKEGEET